MEATEFNAGSITFSIDLRQAALFETEFLQAVEKRSELQDCDSQVMQFAIQRYEKFWLPLVAKYCDRFLAAPIDIEWVWHCHMLNPAAYEKDCSRIVGKVIDHKLLDRERRKQSLQESRVLWRHEYSTIPFEVDESVTPWFDSNFRTQVNYNLQTAVTRQQVFHYQVSLPHYRDEKFLAQCVMRYKKFLFLKKVHPNTFIVPCYDIDLIWHAHMLHPVTYRHDIINIIGHPFNHDDSVNDRRAGSKLTVSDARTRRLWKKTFNEPFSQSGAMFRGEPPAGKLVRIDASEFAALVTKQTTVFLESARVTGLPEHYQGQYKLKLWYNTGYQNFNRGLYVSDSIATVRGSPRHLNSDVRVNANFTFDTKYNDVVMVDLIQKSGRFCMGASAEVGSAQLRMLEKIQALGNGRGISTQDTVDLGDGVGVQLHWSVSPPVTGGYILALKSGDYQDCIMPEMVESMWGPVPLPRLPPGVDNRCSVASHSLLNHTKRVIFTVRIVHSLPLMMSAVHVFFKDKMTAVGHLVGADQLPLPNLVKNVDRCVTLDIKNGERAVLLKNHAGDWGIVLGRWTGMRKPMPASDLGQRGIPGDPGHLEVRFFKFATRHWRFLSFERDYSGRDNKFQIEAATVELDTGLIEISSDAGSEVAENLALAFSVALLHVLCQPRPKDWEPCMEKDSVDVVDSQAMQQRPRMPAEGLALIMAAGFLALVPSNHLLRKRHREAIEAQAEEEARRQREEEEEERRMEQASVSCMWTRDDSDLPCSSQLQDVVAEVSAEDDMSDDVLQVGNCSMHTLHHHSALSHHRDGQHAPRSAEHHASFHHEEQQEPANHRHEGKLAHGQGSANHQLPHHHEGQQAHGSADLHSPTKESPSHLHRLESIAESVEEETVELNVDTLSDEGIPETTAANDNFNMQTVADSLRNVNSKERHVRWEHDNQVVGKKETCFPLPVEDLPLPSADLLWPDPSLEEDLVLPDVPDDDLPLPIEELPPPDLSRLNRPQAEALQMSSVDTVDRSFRDRVVGFDDHSALGYEEYLESEDGTTDTYNGNIEDEIRDTPCNAKNLHADIDHSDEHHIPHTSEYCNTVDYTQYNGDLPDFTEEYTNTYVNGQNNLYLEHSDLDCGFGVSDSHADVSDDHLDIYNGEDVNDMFATHSNYISYEDTHNYDSFCVEDYSWGGGGTDKDSFGGGGDKDRYSWGGDDKDGGGGFYRNCDVEQEDRISGPVGATSAMFSVDGNDFGGGGSVETGFGGEEAECGGRGGGCGG